MEIQPEGERQSVRLKGLDGDEDAGSQAEDDDRRNQDDPTTSAKGFAGFGVLEHSVDASTGLAGSCKASQAYALLQPGQPVPVRTGPSPEATVIVAGPRRSSLFSRPLSG